MKFKTSDFLHNKISSYERKVEHLITEIMYICNLNSAETESNLRDEIYSDANDLCLQKAVRIKKLVLSGMYLNDALDKTRNN